MSKRDGSARLRDGPARLRDGSARLRRGGGQIQKKKLGIWRGKWEGKAAGERGRGKREGKVGGKMAFVGHGGKKKDRVRDSPERSGGWVGGLFGRSRREWHSAHPRAAR